MSVYGYLRVSTETQVEKGKGLDVQKAEIQNYADEHKITVDEYFCDAGISGTTESRPELDRLLLETIRENDTIIVCTTSRLWRNIFAQATVMKAIMDAKAKLISVDEPSFDIYKYMTDPENFMITGMLGMLDQWERMTIARKLARGRATKAQKGDKPAGICPYGYRYAEDKKSVEIDPAEGPAVKIMFTEAQKGKTLSQICETLQEKGIPTRRGGEWTRGSVQAILRNRFYLGELQHQGKTIQGNHEPLISKIQFGKVNSQLVKRHK